MKKRIIPFKIPNSTFLDYLKCSDIFLNKGYVRGKYNKLFGYNFAKQNGCEYGITTNSGSSALYLALQALKLEKGSEIITVSNTFIATITAIELNGLIPIFADIGEDLNISSESIERLITPKTKVILGVHLNGIPYNFNKINKIIKKYNLILIGDACQSHYSYNKENLIGNMADITCFSFYPSKTIDVGGEGGMIITNNIKYYNAIISIQNFGNTLKQGLNLHMSEFHAKIGFLQTKKRNKIILKLDKNKELFIKKLERLKYISFPQGLQNRGSKLCYFPILVNKEYRDNLFDFIKNKGIDCRINYDILISKNRKNYKSDCIYTEKIHKQIIHLPFYIKMTYSDINYIYCVIKLFYDSKN